MSPRTVYRASEGKKFRGDTNLVTVSCATCHITYAIPKSLYDSALHWRGDRADGRGWKLCCPMGHTWWYCGENEEDRLRRVLELERDTLARVGADRDQAKAEAKAQKGRATRFRNDRERLKTRAAAGVCPCCNRTFQNLQRHMAGQHPDFTGDHLDGAA